MTFTFHLFMQALTGDTLSLHGQNLPLPFLLLLLLALLLHYHDVYKDVLVG